MSLYSFFRLFRIIFGKKPIDITEIEAMGLLAVKIAQVFALRADFLSVERCQELQQLLNHVGGNVPPENIDALMDHSLGEDWQSRFTEFDTSPFASASIGQVHRATLTDGTSAAVKLVKTDFANSFAADVAKAKKIIAVATTVYPPLKRVANPKEIIRDIERTTVDELDLRNEVKHGRILSQLKEQYGDTFDFSRAFFPEVVDEHTNERVLTSHFIEGTTLDDLLTQKTLTYDILLDLFKIHGSYLFCIGTFHGDIHPGNIIMQNGNFHFVDTGAISTAGEHLRRGLFTFMMHLSEHNYDACIQALNAMALQSIDDEALERYKKRFYEIYADYKNSTVSQVSLTNIMMQTIKSAVQAGMEFEQGMYPIIKSLMYLDGMVLRCKPNAVLMNDVGDFLRQYEEKILPDQHLAT